MHSSATTSVALYGPPAGHGIRILFQTQYKFTKKKKKQQSTTLSAIAASTWRFGVLIRIDLNRS